AAALQEFVDQRGPGGDPGLRRGCVAVTGHIDQPEAGIAGALEEDQLLGTARRMRGPRQRVAAGQRVDQAGFADIGTAGKCDLQARNRRQGLDRGRGPEELPVAGEQLSPLFDQLRIDVGGHAKAPPFVVMAGLVPAIHVFHFVYHKTGMPGTRPGMTGWIELRAPARSARWRRTNFYVAFFEANVALRLSNNSTFTPLRRMMKLCCSTES